MYSKKQIEIWNLEATISELEAQLIAYECESIYGLTIGETMEQRKLEKRLNSAYKALRKLEAMEG